MPIDNLLEYSSNHSDTRVRFWFYCKDKEPGWNADIGNVNTFQSLKYKTELLGNAVAYGIDLILRNTAVGVTINDMINFYQIIWNPFH